MPIDCLAYHKQHKGGTADAQATFQKLKAGKVTDSAVSDTLADKL